MSQHYSEADLLETYYTQPGESMPVMMHLADCEACAARYERLSNKIRGLASCEHDKPETFWARQRMLILRNVEKRALSPLHRVDGLRARRSTFAAAAALVLALGGLVTWNMKQERTVVVPSAPPVAAVVAEPPAADDPWQSEELKDYQSMVAWESWVEESDKSL